MTDEDLEKLNDKELSEDELLDGRNVLGLDGVSEILEKEIKQLSEKLKTGRIKDEKKEEIRIKMIRTLAYLSQTYARIIEAKKLEELEKRINILETKPDEEIKDVKIHYPK